MWLTIIHIYANFHVLTFIFIKDTTQTVMNIRSSYFPLDEDNKVLIKCPMFSYISKAALIELSLMVNLFNMWIKKVERNACIIIALISIFSQKKEQWKEKGTIKEASHIFPSWRIWNRKRKWLCDGASSAQGGHLNPSLFKYTSSSLFF